MLAADSTHWINMAGVSHWWWMISLILFSGICCMIILIHMIYKFYFLANKPRTSIICFSTFGTISFTINPIVQILVMLQIKSQDRFPTNHYGAIVTPMGILFWTTGQISIYLLFIMNLHDTFYNGPLRLHLLSIVTLVVFTTLFFVFRIGDLIIVTLYYLQIIPAHQIAIEGIVVITAETLDLILSIILCYLFVSRLRLLAQLVQDNDNNISYITRKYVILSSIVVLTTQLSLIGEAIESVTYDSTSVSESTISFEIYYVVRALDSLISSLCIFLNLECNDGYYRYLCCQRNVNAILIVNDEDATIHNTTINSSAYSTLLAK
eukprot:399990_1